MLVLEVCKARLLLPGDAEVGAWSSILANPDSLALASGATFFKVGHHGSHNATPMVFAREHVAKSTLTMISTQEGPGKYRNNIPLTELIDVFTERKLKVARSDRESEAPFEQPADKMWVDCAIPC